MRKSQFFVLLAACVCLVCAIGFASCGNNTDGGELAFVSNGDGTCSVQVGTYKGADVVIPTTSPAGDTVTSIADNAFNDCKKLKSVTIPDTVTVIGTSAFYKCDSLKSVVIPDSVTTVGNYAFYYCEGLQTVELGKGVTEIGQHAFYYCERLTEVSGGENVKTIGNFAFARCPMLSKITIPDGVETIGIAAFKSCRSLFDITLPDTVTSIGRDVFYDTAYYNDEGNWEGDALYLDNFLLRVNTSLKGFYSIDSGTTTIVPYAFYGCTTLTGVSLPDTVTNIGEGAFCDCKKLNSIYFDGTVEAWEAISKGADWNHNIPADTIICSDGFVDLIEAFESET